ncbi:hypothetical protein BaRGS_00003768 [Batillaria attramentaria]|uniref:Uncharacterized protein n=1 Tax=Batillaria attramentaria TaxID=370345 RepID=A0ABD0LYQ3_9CAEN
MCVTDDARARSWWGGELGRRGWGMWGVERGMKIYEKEGKEAGRGQMLGCMKTASPRPQVSDFPARRIQQGQVELKSKSPTTSLNVASCRLHLDRKPSGRETSEKLPVLLLHRLPKPLTYTRKPTRASVSLSLTSINLSLSASLSLPFLGS